MTLSCHAIMKTSTPQLCPKTVVKVDLGALAHNVRALKNLLPKNTQLMAVVKADAYGHGALQAAKTALENGATCLAVARISEAVQLREAGILAPILLFGDISPEHVPYLSANHISITLADLTVARQIQAVAKKANSPLKVHIKIDTGMGRLGIPYDQITAESCQDSGFSHSQAVQDILAIQGMKEFYIEGIYTHLANADSKNKAHAEEQLNCFKLLIEKLKVKGLSPRVCHIANSAAIIDMPKSHLNLARCGIAMYGLWPSSEVNRSRIDLEPVMSIRSEIIQLKEVPRGFKISYGSTHITQTPTLIATVPIGYADGYSRQLSSKGHMLVRGQKAPITGRICMDFTMIDVGHIPGVQLGDEVIILGAQGNNAITADDIAKTIDTINYEVVASLTKRIPVHYINSENKDNRFWRESYPLGGKWNGRRMDDEGDLF